MTEKNQWFELFDEARKSIISPNVLVVGKTGVGKSTLINAMFDGEIAKTGVGKPVSRHLKMYSKEGVPINIWDSQGLELAATAQSHVRAQINQEIRDLMETGEVARQLHICWYCINNQSNRLEDVEIEWIQELSQIMPVVLVLTQTHSLKKDAFFRAIREMNLPVRQVARVLADDYEIDDDIMIRKHGLVELSQITFQLLPEQLRNGYVAAQRVDIEQKVKRAWFVAKATISGSAAAALLPPGADLAGVGLMQATMLAKVTNIFGLSYGKKFFLAVIGGLSGRVGVGALAGYLFGKLAKFSGIGYLAGAAIEAGVTVSVSTALAAAYINICKKAALGKLDGLTEAQIIEEVQNEFMRKRDDGDEAMPDGLDR